MDDHFAFTKKHIINHIEKHHHDWRTLLEQGKSRAEKYRAAKKLVQQAARETKDKNVEFCVGAIAVELIKRV